MAKRLKNPAEGLFITEQQEPAADAPANVDPSAAQPSSQEQPKTAPQKKTAADGQAAAAPAKKPAQQRRKAAAPSKKPESQAEQPQPPAPLVVTPQQRELKTMRKGFILQPSVISKAEEKCKKLGISMNEAVNQLLRSWADMD